MLELWRRWRRYLKGYKKTTTSNKVAAEPAAAEPAAEPQPKPASSFEEAIQDAAT